MLIRAKDNVGNSPIHLAVKKNQLEVTKYLITNFPSVLNMKDKAGRTVLHIAGQNNNKELYQMLVDAGADPMILDQKGRTAEYYIQSHIKPEQKVVNEPSVIPPSLDSVIENKDVTIPNENMDISNIVPNEIIEEKPIKKEEVQAEETKEISDKKDDEKKNVETIQTENKEIQNTEQLEAERKEEKEIASAMQTPSTDTSTGKVTTWDRLNELIDYWIKDKDLLRLEHVVIAGQGERLIGRTSDNKQVQEFLELVPTYMARIRSVHEAVVRGNLGEVKSVLTRKRFALSRDHLGASPLHLAVLHGHTDILRYIINHFPETLDGPDNEGRTPLHYAAIMRDGGHYYKILKNSGADEEVTDKAGHTAEFYMRHPGEVTIRNLLEGYKITVDSNEEPSTINIWQRPPTEEIEKRKYFDFMTFVVISEILIYYYLLVKVQRVFNPIARIRSVHEAVVRGNLGEVKSVLTRKRFALSRDHLGASPLHLAVLHGHTDILRYIINHFPETLDGPDNEGRTPLHYAAIMRDGGHYYKILKNSGADEEVTDKAGHTAEFYMRHPGEVTIRNLLEGYKITVDSNEEPSTINIWQRPPTEEIEKQLTPPSSGENPDKVELNEKETEENQLANDNIEDESAVDHEQDNKEPEVKENNADKHTSNIESEEQPITFDEKTEDGKYLSNVLGDILVKALTEVSQKRPADPIGYLATWLYHFASRKSKDKIRSPVVNGTANTTGAKQIERIEEKNDDMNDDDDDESENTDEKNETELQTTPLDNLNKEPESETQDVTLEFENHTKMKDEEGQTVLHFAASRSHPDGSFYALLSQAELLLAERDSNYHTARDVAVESGMTNNVAAIDNYILDAFISQKTAFLQMLVHEGYDHLLTVTDSEGKDLLAAIQIQTESEGIRALLQEISDFEKNREELHTFVRHDYQEGINKLIEKDLSLITSKNNKGRCSVHIAVLFGNINIIQLLVKANTSSVHVPDNLGRTPLHYAMAMPRIEEIGKILIKAGAIRTARDVRMRTASYFFIYKHEILALQEEEKLLV
ncbi:serine/threonine-protein phosphatase 6 regulatory ankyrin repeat subunit B-like [Centruroides sculpturatus]|uniref:serine/threonine-protein phosphatase 6 regulatory ankyrin repeat subunit B-like n=1 Tax=Centruroides sculpturatus TaxID=218467 RepID=UPI000C6CAEA3|nr:serine/threonine-protein phosphatase 6 regulatory ankyrin repeat subunit B-like [Centruroides sculpturatus]